MVVFTLQHCISLKYRIRSYTIEINLYSAVSLENTCLEIHPTPKHIELQRVVYQKPDTHLDIHIPAKHIEFQCVVYEKEDNFAQCGITSCPD